MPKHLKKFSEEIIHKNPWWTYKHDKYEKPNGEEGDYYYGETLGNAMIVPVLDDGRLVLTLQQRYLREKQSIEFPCGGLIEGQTFLEVAKRELLEETGYIADEFPELPTINESSSIQYSIKVEDFKKAVSQTIITTSSDSTRPVLTGVYWHSYNNQLYLAATDGYRLSERRLVGTKSDVSVIIPTQTLQEVMRNIIDDSSEVDILFDETQVRFRINDAEIISRLIDGNFPDYRQLVPKVSETTVTLNKLDFVRITKIAGLFARESGGSVTLTADSNKGVLSVHSIASQMGENTSEAKAKVTADGQITLNSRYLSEALSVIDGENVEFSFSGKIAPCILKSTDPKTDYYHIIMPLKS